MSATMSKKQSGHLVRISDDHWKLIRDRAVTEQRTVTQMLKIALDVYFATVPNPTPPTGLQPPSSPN